MSNQNQSRLDPSPFPVFLTFFFFLFFLFFCFCFFFGWVLTWLHARSCFWSLKIQKNYFKQLPVHCKQIACIAKKIRDCFSSTRNEVFSNHFISFSFFRKTLRIGADGTSERERTRGIRRGKERRTARFVVTLSQTPPIFSHPSFARLYFFWRHVQYSTEFAKPTPVQTDSKQVFISTSVSLFLT